MINNYIRNKNMIIKIVCEKKVLDVLKLEYGNYYKFISGEYKETFKLYIYINNAKYQKALDRIKNKAMNNNIIGVTDRSGIIMVNKSNNEIIMLYEDFNDNVIQFIGEMIISIFGIIMERQDYFFIHAACVTRGENGIAIIGERKAGKTTILNALLQEKFDYVNNSHLGLKRCNNSVIAMGAPSRMGIRVETMCNVLDSDIIRKIIENTEFNKKFGADAQYNLKKYKEKKFNIKVNEIKSIYNINLKNSTTIKMVIIPIYMPDIKNIKIRKVDKIEQIEIFNKNARRGTYDTMRYMIPLLKSNNKVILDEFKDITVYKIYQNEKNIKELIEFVDSKL